MTQALSYDDVLLVPQYSSIKTRRNVEIGTHIMGELQQGVGFFPFISANMPSVTDVKLASKMFLNGAYGVLHRFNTIDEAVDDVYRIAEETGFYTGAGVSLGLKDYKERSKALYDANARNFFLDVAHGHHQDVMDAIYWLKESYSAINVCAGNVVTYEGAYDLAEVGADAIKVGVGPGAACITREVTGFGVPQVTALMQTQLVKDTFPDVQIIADGGIRNSGDIVKALYFGADLVMIGSIFAGADEAPTPGEYYGNASTRINGHNAPEGVIGTVEKKGPLSQIIKNLVWGVRSGFSYAGAANIDELRQNAEYIIITPAGQVESRARIG